MITIKGKRAKNNQLRASFVNTKSDPHDVLYTFNGGDRSDMALMNDAFTSPRYGYQGYIGDMSKPFLLELIDRGYDITTLDFKIDKLDSSNPEKVELNEKFRQRLSKDI